MVEIKASSCAVRLRALRKGPALAPHKNFPGRSKGSNPLPQAPNASSKWTLIGGAVPYRWHAIVRTQQPLPPPVQAHATGPLIEILCRLRGAHHKSVEEFTQQLQFWRQDAAVCAVNKLHRIREGYDIQSRAGLIDCQVQQLLYWPKDAAVCAIDKLHRIRERGSTQNRGHALLSIRTLALNHLLRIREGIPAVNKLHRVRESDHGAAHCMTSRKRSVSMLAPNLSVSRIKEQSAACCHRPDHFYKAS
eukprot:scaffold83856_cov18-Tisochrysis_lutea.AAC.3